MLPLLHSLIEDGSSAEFEKLLAQHPEQLELQSESGDTPLHIAAWQNEVEMLRHLIALGANVNAHGDSGFAPLHYAAKHGQVESTRELIKAGADLDARDNADFWPIHYALRGREPECEDVELLLEEAGATLDLSCHVMRGDEAKVRALLAHRPEALYEGPLARDLVYDAVMWIRCQAMGVNDRPKENEIVRRYFGLIEALLEAGADPDNWKWSRQSALQLARKSHLPLLVELLIEHGAKP